jgi:hypothetical protein
MLFGPLPVVFAEKLRQILQAHGRDARIFHSRDDNQQRGLVHNSVVGYPNFETGNLVHIEIEQEDLLIVRGELDKMGFSVPRREHRPIPGEDFLCSLCDFHSDAPGICPRDGQELSSFSDWAEKKRLGNRRWQMIIAWTLLLLLAIGGVLRAWGEEPAPVQKILAAPNRSEALNDEDHAYLLRHNPFYFAYGNPISKIQLSFKTQLVRKVPLYFAYTQQMFWALNADSKPFQDLTYNPELFYRFGFEEMGFLKSADVGWAHDSNGKAGADSRSYNTLYARANLEHEFRRWIFRLSGTASYLHAFDDGNEDIGDYIGPFSLKLSWIQLYDAWIDKSEIALTATSGGKFSQNFDYGGYQLSWSFRLGGINLLPSFYFQYYTGYAESLLNYNIYEHAFRGGIMF